jgi:hypothetical protein
LYKKQSRFVQLNIDNRISVSEQTEDQAPNFHVMVPANLHHLCVVAHAAGCASHWHTTETLMSVLVWLAALQYGILNSLFSFSFPCGCNILQYM